VSGPLETAWREMAERLGYEKLPLKLVLMLRQAFFSGAAQVLIFAGDADHETANALLRAVGKELDGFSLVPLPKMPH
jgi:hypothetical protein